MILALICVLQRPPSPLLYNSCIMDNDCPSVIIIIIEESSSKVIICTSFRTRKTESLGPKFGTYYWVTLGKFL